MAPCSAPTVSGSLCEAVVFAVGSILSLNAAPKEPDPNPHNGRSLVR